MPVHFDMIKLNTLTLHKCTHRGLFYDSEIGMMALTTRFCSQASSKQRAGRTGRQRHGTVIRLYTQEMYENFPAYDIPEIQRVPAVGQTMCVCVCVCVSESICAWTCFEPVSDMLTAGILCTTVCVRLCAC